MAKTFGDLVETQPNLRLVVDELSLPYGPDALAGKVDVSNSVSLIEITVSDRDPQLAAKIANPFGVSIYY